MSRSTGTSSAAAEVFTSPVDAPDPFDLDALRVDPNADLIAVQKQIARIAVRKPHYQEFFRTHPEPGFRFDTALIELKADRECFLLAPALRPELGDECRIVRLYTTLSQGGALFLWPVPLPGPDGRQNSWHQTAHHAAEEAKRAWTRIRANQEVGEYDIFLAGGNLPEPEWPSMTFQEILRKAFKDNLISSVDHPVVRKLRGLA
jgi:hypothetical protein